MCTKVTHFDCGGQVGTVQRGHLRWLVPVELQAKNLSANINHAEATCCRCSVTDRIYVLSRVNDNTVMQNTKKR